MDCLKWLGKFSTDVCLKYNSKSTQENYKSCVSKFLNDFNKYREPKEVPTQEIKEWLLQAKTINTRKHRLCSVKSFYSLTVGMPNKIDKIPYPKNDKKLPIILSQEEVQRMFDVCDNIKHRVMLGILYACGLRVSELINLRWSNIDRSRMVINIIQGKGGKDRQTMLPKELIPLLEKYWHEYHSKEYVLNGQFDLQYSSSSVLQVIKQLATKARINKRVYTHLMRHNCFSQMVQNGIDINLIKVLAGHQNVRTTMIYCSIADNIISKIQSPIDQIRLRIIIYQFPIFLYYICN